jgi:hypothetical protein
MHRADKDFGLPKRTDEGRVARKKGLAQIATELGKYVLNAADVTPHPSSHWSRPPSTSLLMDLDCFSSK